MFLATVFRSRVPIRETTHRLREAGFSQVMASPMVAVTVSLLRNDIALHRCVPWQGPSRHESFGGGCR